jgi:hypothetical protein
MALQDRHYKTVALDMQDAHALLMGWAFEIEGWHRGHAWSRLDQPSTGPTFPDTAISDAAIDSSRFHGPRHDRALFEGP